MNLDRLRAVQSEEREADSLRPLPDAFYREVAEYLEALRARRAEAAAAAEDPFGAEDVRRLTDEIETAEEVAEAIYERRVGKLVKRASLAAAGMPTDEEGLTDEEAELFADLVAEIEAHRAEVLAAFESRGSAGSAHEDAGDASEVDDEMPTPPPDGEADAHAAMDPAATMGSDPTDEDGPPDDADPDGDTDLDGKTDGGGTGDAAADERVTVRITRDVGEVFGVDERVYDLASEDVVTLPTANARPLLEKDAAEEIN